MNPQQQLPPNYLDQIAPQAPKRSFALSKLQLVALFGIIAIVVVIILSLVLSSMTGGKKGSWERLAARLEATSQIAKSSDGKIKNSQLRTMNSNVKISLTNTQRDLAAPLLAAGVNAKKLSTSIVAEESSQEALTRLENARLNAKYDSTYGREMTYQLSNVLTLLSELYNSTSNADSKTFLKTTYDNFEPVQKSLADFSASNE